MCRYARRNKRADLKIFFDIRKEKAVINMGKIVNQVSTINCGQVDKKHTAFGK